MWNPGVLLIAERLTGKLYCFLSLGDTLEMTISIYSLNRQQIDLRILHRLWSLSCSEVQRGMQSNLLQKRTTSLFYELSFKARLPHRQPPRLCIHQNHEYFTIGNSPELEDLTHVLNTCLFNDVPSHSNFPNLHSRNG